MEVTKGRRLGGTPKVGQPRAVEDGWLAELPAHWDVSSLRFLLRSLDQGWSPSAHDRLAAEDEWGVLKLSAVANGQFRPKLHKVLPPDVDGDPSIEVRPGDVLVTRANTPDLVGAACYVASTRPRLMFSDLIYRLQFRKLIVPQFATYWLISVPGRHQIHRDARGSSLSMVKISQSHIRAWRMPVPPRSEQRTIATFLDRETAKIDALIDKKQRLIELLQEKRTALITQAVTQGLDPEAEMKDSGVEWLGEIPAHWDVVRAGRLVSIGNGSTPNRSNQDYWDDGTFPWLTSARINDGIIRAAEEFVTHRALRDCHLPIVLPDSVLVAITGEGQTRGRAALLDIKATISQHLAYLTPNSASLVAEYLWRFLQARYAWLRSESSGGGSTRAALTCEFLKGVPLVVPPRREQLAIIQRIRKSESELAPLLDRADDGVRLLKEYRTALISAAVTGKIDVREELQ